MCFNLFKPKAQTMKEDSVASQALSDLLSLQLPLAKVLLWDSTYWYISHEDWGKVFQDVLLNLPTYITDKFDCDNFSMVTAARIMERYQLNSCGLAIGQSPMGDHAWNIFYDNIGFHYLEPQSGDVIELDNTKGYKAELIILG